MHDLQIFMDKMCLTVLDTVFGVRFCYKWGGCNVYNGCVAMSPMIWTKPLKVLKDSKEWKAHKQL